MFNSKLIKTAWKIRRQSAQVMNCKISEVSWKECLKLAIEAIKTANKNYKKDKFYSTQYNKDYREYSIHINNAIESKIQNLKTNLNDNDNDELDFYALM